MRLLPTPTLVAAALLASAGGVAHAGGPYTESFDLDASDLASVGRNPYFILEPGYTLVLEDGDEQLTITVLDETRRIGAIEARVVEEREKKGGHVKEVSRNYFAISRRTNSVFYFGEEVDKYKDDRVVDHEGAWMAGAEGARAGLMMPGLPLLGARYQQEVAPGKAMDRAEVVEVGGTLATPAAEFRGVLKVQETTPLESFVKEHKFYAPDVGLVQDGSLKLVRHGRP